MCTGHCTLYAMKYLKKTAEYILIGSYMSGKLLRFSLCPVVTDGLKIFTIRSLIPVSGFL